MSDEKTYPIDEWIPEQPLDLGRLDDVPVVYERDLAPEERAELRRERRKAKFGPEDALVPAESPRRPVTARDLLRDLGLRTAPLAEQRAGVARWVRANEPDGVLRASLRRAGLLDD